MLHIRRITLVLVILMTTASLPAVAATMAIGSPAHASTVPPSPPPPATPNPTGSVANPYVLHLGDTVPEARADGAGNLETEGDEDVYALDIAAPGKRVQFRYFSGGYKQWVLRAWDPVSSTPGAIVFEGGLGTRVPVFLPAGSYRLTVTGYWNYAVNWPGGYSFEVVEVPQRDRFSISLNTTIPDDITVNKVAAGNLESPGAEDEYTFHVNAPGQLIEMQSKDSGCGLCKVRIRNYIDTPGDPATGRYVYEHAYGNLGPIWLPGGDYTLVISASEWNDSAVEHDTYSFYIGVVPTPSASVALTLGTGMAGNMTNMLQTNAYTLALGSQSNVRFKLTNGAPTPAAGCLHYSVIAPGGAVLFDGTGVTPDAILALSAGTYKINVTNPDNGYAVCTGDYVLTASDAGTAALTARPEIFSVAFPTPGTKVSIPPEAPPEPVASTA
jgi:hypothetical protein